MRGNDCLMLFSLPWTRCLIASKAASLTQKAETITAVTNTTAPITIRTKPDMCERSIEQLES